MNELSECNKCKSIVCTNVKPTARLCFVALLQGDVDLHDGNMLHLNLYPKSSLHQYMKG